MKGKVSPFVDGRSQDEEKDKCSKKTIPKNTTQRRTKGEQKEPIYQSENYISSSNKEREN